jgi:polar amino acid transport system substrate-binding protein
VAIRRSALAVLSLVAAGALTLSACASNNESGNSTPSSAAQTTGVTKDDSIAALLPDKIKSSGKLIVAVNVPYAPNEFKDSSGKIVGFDVDLMNATATVMGLTVEYREADFDKIVPAVEGGTYDVGMSSFTDNKTREKTVDFVTYFNAGTQWAEPSGKTVDPDNACGLKVAVQSTTVQDTDDLPARSKKCTDAGKPAITKLKYDRQDDATTALVLGKVDAMAADSPVTAYAVKQSGGKIALAGSIYDAAPYGWAVAKGSPLAQAMQKAVQKLMDDGTYKSICESWNVQAGAITTSKINDAQS